MNVYIAKRLSSPARRSLRWTLAPPTDGRTDGQQGRGTRSSRRSRSRLGGTEGTPPLNQRRDVRRCRRTIKHVYMYQNLKLFCFFDLQAPVVMETKKSANSVCFCYWVDFGVRTQQQEIGRT